MSLQNFDGAYFSSKFEQDATDQHKALVHLKQQHEELDRELEQKVADLNIAQQKSTTLKDDIETHSIRIMKKEEALAKVQATSERLQDETEEIRKQIKTEKQKQIDDLKLYENKMASIAVKLQNGPIVYDRKNIQVDIASLQEEMCAISKEMTLVEEELNEVHVKYQSMFNTSLDNPRTNEGYTFELEAVHSVTSKMAEDIKLYHSEEQRLCEEVKNLSRMLTALEEDLKELKQGHNLLQ